MKIDIHVHLAGVGTGGSACWMSERLRRRITFRILRWWHRITDEQIRTSVDQDWAAKIANLVRESQLDRAVALGFDGAYDSAGRLDEARSQMIIPLGWVFSACQDHPDALLPGPSINPHAADAVDRLQEAADRGAVLIKWLPSAQAIDPAARSILRFYQVLADRGLPLLVHTGGGEQTFEEIAPEFNDVKRLHLPLDTGVTVVCAHSGAPVVFSGMDQSTLVRQLLHQYDNLWLDNSGLANPSRFPSLPRYAVDPLYRSRTLHGSDFPVPVHSFYYAGRLGLRRVRQLESIANPFDRDVELKRALGYPEETFRRAMGLLANVA